MSGTGAYLAGGRWNAPGRRVVYASGNISLAMLEILVHLDDSESFFRQQYVFHAIRFPAAAVATLAEGSLPAGWNSNPVPPVSQAVGDEWLDLGLSPVLAVPSVLVPDPLQYLDGNLNYLINPEHPEASDAIRVGEVFSLTPDRRLGFRPER